MLYKPTELGDNQRVLITGGCGFIGSHLADLLMREGYQVALLDSLVAQVHGSSVILDDRIPEWTKRQTEAGAKLFIGDINVPEVLLDAFVKFRPHTVVHLAAEVGVGQAEHEIVRYLQTNVVGTGNVIEAIQRANDSVLDGQELDGVRRLVTAGSMSSYGEGLYKCRTHGEIRAARRSEDILDQQFDAPCPYTFDGRCDDLNPVVVQIPEWSSLRPNGVYAATKRDTEELVMNARRTGLSCAALRLFNVLGPRQSLRNPYTGVCAIFAARCLSGLGPRIYEDGAQVRDFVHVRDVVEAFKLMVGPPQIRLALRIFADEAYQDIFNVCTGVGTSIKEVAEWACDELAPDLKPEITMQARVGDIRSCIGNPAKLTQLTGWSPMIDAQTGIRQLFRDLRSEAGGMSAEDLDRAHSQLVDRRLVLSTDVPNGIDPHAELGDVDEEERGRSGWLGPVGPAGEDAEALFEDETPA